MMTDKKKIAALIVGGPERPEEDEAEGGEAEFIAAAEGIMDALDGDRMMPAPGEGDSPVQKASKEAGRKAKAKILAQALRDFLDIYESKPHAENNG